MNDRTEPAPEPAPPLLRPCLSLVPPAPGSAAAEPGLTRLALAARAGDRQARDTLYQSLAPNIDRMVAGCARLTRAADCPRRNGQPWDREDLAQEAFLVYCDLVRAWSGQGPFTPYLFAYFPWRLRNAWRRLRPERPHGTMMGHQNLDLVVDESAEADEARLLLESVAGRLPEPDRSLLLAHVRDGVTLAMVARRLGLSSRQVRRRWGKLKLRLRREIEPPPRSGRLIAFPTPPRD